jgi:hypothetical protein
LLQIKQIERAMAISGQYDRARAMHSEGERLAAREAEELQANLIRDYRIAKDQLLRDQQAERDKLESDRARLRTVLDARKKIDAAKRTNRRNVVEQRQTEALKLLRERSGNVRPDYGASVTGSVQSKGRLRENVIPPLFAPNDPRFVEEDRKRVREKRRIQNEYQRRNAELALMDYRVQPSPRSDTDEGRRLEGAEEQPQREEAAEEGFVVDADGENPGGREEEGSAQPAVEQAGAADPAAAEEEGSEQAEGAEGENPAANEEAEEVAPVNAEGENPGAKDEEMADATDQEANEEEERLSDGIAELGSDIAVAFGTNADEGGDDKEV